MYEVVQVEPRSLGRAPWRSTYTVSPDLAVLARSLATFGVLSPIVVRTKDMTIIDGHERCSLAAMNEAVRDSVGATVPAVLIDCSERDAMILHVQMNRGRGSVVAKKLSSLVRLLTVSSAATEDEICRAFNMTFDELDLLVDGTIIKHRAIKDHLYSRAWVPVESSAKVTSEPGIEAPPNDDR